MPKPRLALIGCGDISDFHVPACRKAGFEITSVCSRPESVGLRAFAQRHDIPLVFDSVEKLMGASRNWDALLIAVPVEVTKAILMTGLDTGTPILVEKPVALRAADLLPFVGQRLSVIVGYNRRFYRTVREARWEVESGPSVLAHLSIPESILIPDSPDEDPNYLKPFFSNSVHGLDLARYIFGHLHVEHVSHMTNPGGAITGLVATLRAEDGSVVQFTGNWGASANFSLVLDRPGHRLELRPFEAGAVYEGMEVREPSQQIPSRTYIPKLAVNVDLDEIDREFKPGFVSQAEAFAALVRGEDPRPAATLEDAHAVLELAEQLVFR